MVCVGDRACDLGQGIGLISYAGSVLVLQRLLKNLLVMSSLWSSVCHELISPVPACSLTL